MIQNRWIIVATKMRVGLPRNLVRFLQTKDNITFSKVIRRALVTTRPPSQWGQLISLGSMRPQCTTDLLALRLILRGNIFHSFRSPQCLMLNPLTPNDLYMSRTAPLTSKLCILYIYSTNVGTEYFKHALYSPFFSLQNAVCFIMLTCLVPVLFTFYIQDVLKLKK